MSKRIYNKRVWLNPESCSYTGSLIAYHERYENWRSKEDYMYLEIADCRHKISLHCADHETKDDFLVKMKLIRDELNSFIDRLEEKDNRK